MGITTRYNKLYIDCYVIATQLWWGPTLVLDPDQRPNWDVMSPQMMPPEMPSKLYHHQDFLQQLDKENTKHHQWTDKSSAIDCD